MKGARGGPGPGWRAAALLLAAAVGGVASTAGCGDGAGSTAPPRMGDARVHALETVSGEGQRILAGRRSPEPFRVRALDDRGRPVDGAVVDFTLAEGAEGVLSQPRALTADDGIAETFLLQPRSGTGRLVADVDDASASFELEVERAPWRLEFEEGTGEPGLPGKSHPDSVVRVRVLDTEDRPMAGVEVWFAGHRHLSEPRDTSDADGWASTVIRESGLEAGEGRVYAFLLDFPELTEITSRPVVPAARRVVLVSIDGLRGDAVERHALPNLARMAEEGGWSDRALTVEPALTVPAHLSMLSGVGPTRHGIRTEELAFTAEMAALDPVFRATSREGLTGLAFMASEGPLAGFEVALDCRLAFGLDSLTLVDGDAMAITAEAEAALDDPDVRVVFIHLPDPDVTGHLHGFESEEYGRAALRADSAVGRIAARLDEGDLLVVTSDHGGGGAWGSHQHGSRSDADMRVPLLLWGARAVPGLLNEASVLDVAPTILWSLGLRPPLQYTGRTLLEAFR